MGKVVPLIVLMAFVGLGIFVLFVRVLLDRVRRPPARVIYVDRIPELEDWRQRLEQLHYLLVQVMSSDQTLTHLPSLPLDVANKLRRYFNGSMQPPRVADRKLVNRVVLLEGYLAEVLQAHRSHPALSALPAKLVEDLERYDRERQRRLES